MKLIYPLIGLLLLVSSCSNFVTVEKSEELVQNKKSIKKVVCIAPDIICFNNDIFSGFDSKKTLEMQSFFISNLQKHGKRAADFEFEIFHPLLKDAKLTSNYFDYLLPLKAEILETIFSRENEVDRDHFRSSGKAIQKSVFADAPKISPEYAHLSKTYGTPYFAWYGVLSSNNLSVIILTIVNVETMQVTEREVIYLRKSIGKRSLPALIYDSFIYIN